MSEPKKQNYLHGAAILTVGVVIMKILGAIYKIPLSNILGDAGYGYFNAAYNIYNVFLTISTAGLPVALSRMISEANALGRYNQARRTFRVAFGTLAALGAVITALMLLLPSELAIVLAGKPESTQSITALAPAVLLVCLTSCYRGFIQGHGDMRPTTVGQVLEVLVKVIVGLTLALVLVRSGKSLPVASAGAIFGVTVGSLAALLYMAFKCRDYRIPAGKGSDTPDSAGRTLAKFLKVGIPITLGASVMSVITLLDTKLVNEQLLNSGMSKQLADTLYGSYSTMMTLYNLPAAFITPITISVVPAISAAVASKRHSEAGETAESAMRIGCVIAMPMGVGLSVLASPIVGVLYPNTHEVGPTLLCYLGIASFFVCFALITNAILQANGNEKLTVITMLVGGAVKLGVNWILVGNPEINIVGAPIGTICCYAAMSVLNCVFLRGAMSRSPRLSRVLLRPAISSAVMGVAAYGVYALASRAFTGGRMMTAIGMVIAIAAAVIVYLVMVIATRAVTYDDMKLIPKGEKIARVLRIK